MIYKFQTNHSNDCDCTDFIEFIPVYDEKKLLIISSSDFWESDSNIINLSENDIDDLISALKKIQDDFKAAE